MEVINLKTKIAIMLSVLIIFASIGFASAYRPQPHAMVWIVNSDVSANVWTITYENFGYKSIGSIGVSIVSEMAIASVGGATPSLASYSAARSYPGWTTLEVSSQQIYWQSNHAGDRMAFDFSLYNAPCSLQYTIYDKNSNPLQTGTVSVA